VSAGIPEAFAAKAAFDALDSMPFKWKGPATTNSPERQTAIRSASCDAPGMANRRLPKNPAE
jgi:hypothetical protein